MKENDFLAWIAAQTPPHPAVSIPIGDDMAAVTLASSPSLVLLKIDQCLDGVHFDLRMHSPAQAARKAVNRCLSDCAAMAVLPAAIMLSVALPDTADEAFARELFLAARDAAAVFGCPLVGGDTAIWDQRLAITIAAMGFAATPPVTRAGAKAGDIICVTGQLGGSILGRHLTFRPRIEEAQTLIKLADIHAMMDLSDGLATDLPRLCQMSKVGAVINSGSIPIHPDAFALAKTSSLSPLHHALCDGEDYELLFTLSSANFASLQKSWPAAATCIAPIGTITPDAALILLDESESPQPWPASGWQHQSK